MKKINMLLCTAVSALFLGGCEENEDLGGSFAETQLTVKSANVIFSAAAGSGTIVVSETEGAISAVSDQTWCKVSVANNTVAVNIDANNSISGRTALITLKADSKENHVPVTQAGAVLTLATTTVDVDGKEGQAKISFEADITVSSITSPDNWITGFVEGQELTLQFQANPSYSESRTGQVSLHLANGTMYDRIMTVTQNKNYFTYEELEYKHFLGEYTMSYSTSYSSVTASRSTTVTLVQAVEGETYYLEGLLSDADEALGNIVVGFVNDDNGKGITLNGQIIFQRENGNDFWLVPLSKVNTSSRSTTYGMRGNVGRDGKIIFTMEDNGRWASVIAGLILRNYAGSTYTNVNGKDGQAYYCYPVLVKKLTT
ncbi:MAG: BACON domain-containing protein [Tannerella sp.]|nr:BACON domain-containing protein [Tannerella sp.]